MTVRPSSIDAGGVGLVEDGVHHGLGVHQPVSPHLPRHNPGGQLQAEQAEQAGLRTWRSSAGLMTPKRSREIGSFKASRSSSAST